MPYKGTIKANFFYKTPTTQPTERAEKHLKKYS